MWRQPRVSIYRNCEGFKKRWKSHFRKIDEIRKIAVFWTILFSKVEKRINGNLSHCNVSLLYFITGVKRLYVPDDTQNQNGWR